VKSIKALFLRHKDIILYLIFGVLTTVVNYLVYLPCYNYLELSSVTSNCIAWCVAVAFAFLTNKPIVFRSHDWSAKTLLPELGKFVSCRVATGVMETLILFVAVDLAHLDGNILKIFTNIAVIILNYLGSRIIVFCKKSAKSDS
jgi:putative flippase GtrA